MRIGTVYIRLATRLEHMYTNADIVRGERAIDHAANATAAAPAAAAAANARACGLAVGTAAPVESVLKMATELAAARDDNEAATALAS